MIRPEFDIDLPDEPIQTIRVVVEWFKAHLGHEFDPTAEEDEHMNKRWAYLITKLAEEQQVPVGWLSAAVSQLVEAEWSMKLAAELEGAASGVVENFGDES